MTTTIESFTYDDATPRRFLAATIFWGIVGMLVGLLCALQLASPAWNLGLEWLSFGRLRPLHTNAVIFAFAGNAFFTGCYYSIQRLLKARLWAPWLSSLHFWGWQAIIVGAALTLPFGHTQGKEYAELEWPLDIAIAVVWVGFAINVFGTIAKRRERHLYVAIWFYLASIVTVAILHIFNNLSVPAGPLTSYSVYSGVQDAFMQWWYGHNAVAFFLTTPFLGLMYYFLPKAADRPVFSYRLSILHFWSLVFLYIWAGPHHLHYTALPEWCATLGMLFSIMLWMPSWGGMINGLLTLRGAWSKVASDTVLKFFVVAITFYGMATFEGPMMSIKSVNALSHYTDWGIAHVHGGALGWVGFMSFGMAYWLAPRLFQTRLWSPALAEAHFWSGTVGILLYCVAIYAAGLTQGLMWMATDSSGHLVYPDFIETVVRLKPMYWARVVGGGLYVLGAIACGLNLLMTWRAGPVDYVEPTVSAPPLSATVEAHAPAAPSPLRASGAHFPELAYKLEAFTAAAWHRTWERLPVTFTVMTTVAVVVASLLEIVPTFLARTTEAQAIARPYTPLELLGRDVYLAEGCYTCHSQMVRPLLAETLRYGPRSEAGESIYDHPFQWGSRRIGPDLQRVGGKYPHLWHVEHMRDPQAISPGSIMPSYAHLLERPLEAEQASSRVRAMTRLGVPYSEADLADAEGLARAQAERIARDIVAQGGPAGLEDRRIVALVAYLQRLGMDRKAARSAQVVPGLSPAEPAKEAR